MKDAFLAAKLKKKYGDEQVYVVPSADMENIPDKYNGTVDVKLNTTNGRFIPRYDAEYDNSFQQIIPYIIVTNKAHDKIFVTRRKAGEERLQDSFALGCGGHINLEDIRCGHDYSHIFGCGADRELHEELEIIPKNIVFQTIGTVRGLSSKTSDHLGVVLLVQVDSAKVKETDKLEGKWMSVLELADNYSKFENWAKYIIDHLFEHDKDRPVFSDLGSETLDFSDQDALNAQEFLGEERKTECLV